MVQDTKKEMCPTMPQYCLCSTGSTLGQTLLRQRSPLLERGLDHRASPHAVEVKDTLCVHLLLKGRGVLLPVHDHLTSEVMVHSSLIHAIKAGEERLLEHICKTSNVLRSPQAINRSLM